MLNRRGVGTTSGIGVFRKLGQFSKLMRESYAEPMKGESRHFRFQGSRDENGITFIGHSSFLLTLGGKVVLVDPVFAERLIVLRRQRRPGLEWRSLPAVDVVLLTHAHMDHLNLRSLRRVVRRTVALRGKAPEVVVPRGVEDLVRRIGFSRVHALGWWEQARVAGLEVTATPAKHWGARLLKDTHRGFGGYVVRGGGRSVYHSGDTAYFDGFHAIGERLHPEVALLPIGAYFPDAYRAVHTSPEEALRGFLDLGATTMVAMHFGTFRLGREPMEEPPLRLCAEAKRRGVADRVHVLKEGETLLLEQGGPELAFQDGSETRQEDRIGVVE